MTPETYTNWRAARAGCITASQFKRVMDAKTPRAWRTLLADIRSEAAAIEQGIFTETTAAALQWGKDYEARALATYTIETGNDCRPAPFMRLDPSIPIGASCDAFVGDDGLAEAKCPYSMDGFDRYVREGVGSVKWQALGQLWITGRQWCDVVIFDPRRAEDDRLHVVRIYRHDYADDFFAMMKRVREFADHLVNGTEPQGAKFAEAAWASATEPVDFHSTPTLF